MTNYVPLFASLTTGTLCGRWPDVGMFPIVLSLADRHGVVDVTTAYLAGITGLPIDQIEAVMQRFCEPDPYSRTAEQGGARLVLIDPANRNWGWRVVNHGKYRERARLAAKNAAEVDSGKNRGRMDDRRGPPDTAADPLLNKTKQDKTKTQRARSRQGATDFHQKVVDQYHQRCPDLPRIKVWTDGRAKSLDARIAERLGAGKPADTLGYWSALFDQVGASDFLCGRSSSWKADLEWLLKPNNFAKVIEGRYSGNRGNGGRQNE